MADDTNNDVLIATLADKLAHAISIAEGYQVPGSLPNRIHNPGDMKLGDRGWGTDHDKTIYFKSEWSADINDHTDGCSALKRECIAILSGLSHTMPVTMTLEQLASTWTGGDNDGPWVKIVSEYLNLDPSITMADWVKSEVGIADDQG